MVVHGWWWFHGCDGDPWLMVVLGTAVAGAGDPWLMVVAVLGWQWSVVGVGPWHSRGCWWWSLADGSGGPWLALVLGRAVVGSGGLASPVSGRRPKPCVLHLHSH